MTPRAVAALLLAALATPAQADGNPERGGALAGPCVACHGEAGNSTMESSPSLAAQPPDYLFLQMFLIRDGLRPLPKMQPFVAGKSDQDLQDLAAFYAAQELAPEPRPRNDALYARGAELSPRLRCASCHGPGYAGQQQVARLAGQREDYLLHAMQQYQNNERFAADTSMVAVLHGLSADDLAALAHYLAHQR